jgi:multidrug efflux pump subunit AcrA (membrane-fusion protein)
MGKTTKIALIAFSLAIAFMAGSYSRQVWQSQPSRVEAGQPTKTAGAATDDRPIAYWYDSMNPSFHSDKPGVAADGMKLLPKYQDQLDKMEGMPSGSVMLSGDQQQLIGVKTAPVMIADLSRTLRTVGHVEADETRIAHVHTKFQGWIAKVYVDFVGQLVHKGDPLFSVYSPELVATQQEYLIALRSRDTLSKGIYREIGGDPDALVNSALQRLRLWDISEDQLATLARTGEVTRTLLVLSPVTGYVLTREAYENASTMPDKELYTVADLSHIWVTADIYEYEASAIRLGQSARMSLSYKPGKKYDGKISYIYPSVDPNTRTLKVRLEFANPGIDLKPNMFADIELTVGSGRSLQVPAEAVLDSGTRKIVFVAKGDGNFEPREIRVAEQIDGRYVVISGLEANETIVTSGNFLIDSESNLKSMSAPAHQHGSSK